jgi:hypothetical protein
MGAKSGGTLPVTRSLITAGETALVECCVISLAPHPLTGMRCLVAVDANEVSAARSQAAEHATASTNRRRVSVVAGTAASQTGQPCAGSKVSAPTSVQTGHQVELLPRETGIVSGNRGPGTVLFWFVCRRKGSCIVGRGTRDGGRASAVSRGQTATWSTMPVHLKSRYSRRHQASDALLLPVSDVKSMLFFNVRL